MASFQPPPTYAEVVLIDPKTNIGRFNPIWLNWFLGLVQFIDTSGGAAGVDHNSTGGLQGGVAGSPGEFYHLTKVEHDGTLTLLKRAVITYSASITIDASLADEFSITATNGTAFTINSPISSLDGQRITVMIRNSAGGALGVITWNAVFKMLAFTSPTNGNSCAIDFWYDGTNWVQVSPQSLQVPN